MATDSYLPEGAGRCRLVRHSFPLLEIVTLLPMAGTYLYNAWRFSFPAGYGGLYALMAEILARQPFPLPAQIPFYGPGGIPFAYPPLALYLAALFVGPLHVPMLGYLRWAPGVVCILTMAAVYLLGRQWTGDRLKAVVAVVIVFSAEIVYSYHGTASGSVRSVALLWTVLAAYFSLRAYIQDRLWPVHAGLAGLCLALTALTHLTYAAFLVPGIVLMAFLAPGPRRALWRLRTMVIIGLTGLLLAAPWWGTVMARYGPAVFINAAGTHGTGGLLADVGANPLGLLRAFLRWYANLGRTWWPGALSGLAILGFAYGLARRRWLIPAWVTVTVAGLGQTDRFEILLCGLMAGEALVDLARFVSGVAGRAALWGRNAVAGLAFLALALGPLGALGFRGIQWTEVELTAALVDTGRWIEGNTPPDSQYLYLGSSHDVGEWLPYLTHRTPGISPWGAEWTGKYDRERDRLGQLSACVSAKQVSCVEAFAGSAGLDVGLLIVPVEENSPWVSLEQDASWQLAFDNRSWRVYARTGSDGAR
ncbi:MAG: hypothetical protein FJZ97_02645 [Chloroflexi bacterium]|nr:hypothetical protein [Chloroflexota bacterium]